MDNVFALLRPTINFIQTNSYKLIVGIILLAISVVAFYITITTLRKLKMEIFSYYPFDRFFPQAGQWSVLYFLIVVVLLGALIYFLSKGGFYLAPA